jgi:hypothetical protein
MERGRHQLTNPFDIILNRRAKSDSPAPQRGIDPFEKARKARPGTASAFSHLHDSFRTVGKELAEQRPLPFEEILQMLLPPKLASTKTSSEPQEIMAKLKEIGKTTWFVFKHVIKVVKAASGSCTHLQEALEGLSLVLDQLDVSAVLFF